MTAPSLATAARIREHIGELAALADLSPSRLEEVVVAEIDAAGRTPDVWLEPPHLPGSPDPDPLPVDVLPAAVRRYVESVAESLQVPPDLPLLLALGAVSATVAGHIEVEPRPGWREPVGLYMAVILPPASRKSPAYEAITGPLRDLEAGAVQRAAPAVLAAQDLVEVAERKLDRVKADAAKDTVTTADVEYARLSLEEAVAAVPPDGRLLAGDITPEAMVQRMAAQGGRLAVLEPEPGPLQLVAGRYSDRARLDELKKAWSGETLRVDRVGRSPLRVARPALTLGLCIQPGVLENLQNGPAFRLEGMLGRVLWCQPPHGLGSRRTGREVPPLDVAARSGFAGILGTLFGTEPAERDEDGNPLPHVLRLDPGALDVLHEFEAEVEVELADGGRYAEVRDWAGKMVGQSLRVAALLEVAARAGDRRPLFGGPVGPWAMTGAVRLLRALGSHALVVLDQAGADERTDLLRYVLRRARELPAGGTLRHLWQATRGKVAIQTVEDLRDLVDDLTERGCLRLLERHQDGAGRPPSPTVEIHPHLRESIPNIPEILGDGGKTGGSGDSGDAGSGMAGEPPDRAKLLTEALDSGAYDDGPTTADATRGLEI